MLIMEVISVFDSEYGHRFITSLHKSNLEQLRVSGDQA